MRRVLIPSYTTALKEQGPCLWLIAVSGDELLLEDNDGIRVITLNRPERLNALTASIMGPVADACADAARDAGVRCLVVKGAGPRLLCRR